MLFYVSTAGGCVQYRCHAEGKAFRLEYWSEEESELVHRKEKTKTFNFMTDLWKYLGTQVA